MKIPSEWTFKRDDVAIDFDSHVREQLPWYELMSGAVAHIARHYIPDQGVIYDLGCSTGNIGRLLAQTVEARNCTFIPIDNSRQMVSKYSGPGEPVIADIGRVRVEQFDVAISFLCLMFIPRKCRAGIIRNLRDKVNNGGAIIIVDKFESIGGYLGTAINRLTLAGKVASGVPTEQIIDKELSLIGIQRPIAESELGDAREVFRFGEFAGYVIEGSCETTQSEAMT